MWPVRVAEEALKLGRSYGRYEQGGDPERPDGEGEFTGYVEELWEVSRLCLAKTGRLLKDAAGEKLARGS